MTLPRTAAEVFAEQMGVSVTYARQYLTRFPDSDTWDESDAVLRAEAAMADLDAERSVDEIDLDDAALEPNPQHALRAIVGERSERILRARLAAHTRWSRTSEEDRQRQSERMREGFYARFERQVDPDGTLDPAERARRANHAMKAHMLGLALKSSKARRQRKGRA